MRISTLSLLDRLIRNIFVAILLLIILLIITFIVASHQQKVISKPILKLTALTEKITKNQDYSVKMEYTGIDEISKLYKEISLMLSEITLHQHERDKAEEKLKKLNEELETRVNERTSQLLAINKELESFSYSISHDLRAPLRAIYGFSQILSRRHRDSLNEEGRQYMDYIVESSVRMEHLINDLLNYSRLGRKSVEMRPISLQKILDNIHHDFSQKLKEVGGKLIFEGYDTEIHGDESLLQQIFINLVENAITYRRIEVPLEIKIMCVTNPDSYLIKVSDNGIGIPEEFWEKIFNIFQRLHSDEEYPGTGIGLANVKKSVDKLNGEVWVESVVGQGSTFFIKLPQPKNIFQNV
jgi:signal transduction histidine kinase